MRCESTSLCWHRRSVQSAAMANSSSVDQACEILRKHAANIDSTASWPAESLRAISDSGLWIPGSMREFADSTRRFSQACTSSAMIYLMHVCAIQVIAGAPNKYLFEKVKGERALEHSGIQRKGKPQPFLGAGEPGPAKRQGHPD